MGKASSDKDIYTETIVDLDGGAYGSVGLGADVGM